MVFYCTPVGLVWFEKGEKPGSVVRHSFSNPKKMITLFQNPDGTILFDWHDKDGSFNSVYFINYV